MAVRLHVHDQPLAGKVARPPPRNRRDVAHHAPREGVRPGRKDGRGGTGGPGPACAAGNGSAPGAVGGRSGPGGPRRGGEVLRGGDGGPRRGDGRARRGVHGERGARDGGEGRGPGASARGGRPGALGPAPASGQRRCRRAAPGVAPRASVTWEEAGGPAPGRGTCAEETRSAGDTLSTETRGPGVALVSYRSLDEERQPLPRASWWMRRAGRNRYDRVRSVPGVPGTDRSLGDDRAAVPCRPVTAPKRGPTTRTSRITAGVASHRFGGSDRAQVLGRGGNRPRGVCGCFVWMSADRPGRGRLPVRAGGARTPGSTTPARRRSRAVRVTGPEHPGVRRAQTRPRHSSSSVMASAVPGLPSWSR